MRGRQLRVLVEWVGEREATGNPWQYHSALVGRVGNITAMPHRTPARISESRSTTTSHDVSKKQDRRYAPEDLGKRARKDGVAKRRAQDEDIRSIPEVRLRNGRGKTDAAMERRAEKWDEA